MTAACFFGYGSLVNRATHAHENPSATKAFGWRRAWVSTNLRPRPFLTAVRAPGAEILGLVAEVNGSWDALDAREGAYERHILEQSEHPLGPDRDLRIYAIAPDIIMSKPTREPFLLSYLDVVVQGYFREFGAEGVTHFFATTDGWNRPVLNDRAAPVYSRAQRLSDAETEIVDHHLAQIGVEVLAT